MNIPRWCGMSKLGSVEETQVEVEQAIERLIDTIERDNRALVASYRLQKRLDELLKKKI